MSTSWSQKISILLLVAVLSTAGAAFGQSPAPLPEPDGATSFDVLTTLQSWWAQAWAELGLGSTAGASADARAEIDPDGLQDGGPGMEPPGQTDTGEGGPEMCPNGLQDGGPGMDPNG